MHKTLIALVATLGALAVTVGASGKNTSTVAIPGCATSSLNLVTPGTLTVGTDNPAYPPWFGGEEKTKPWKISDPYSGKGYESAVAYAIAKQLGFANSDVKWVVVPFSKSFAPGKKNFDFDVNQISFSPVRAKAVTFSTSYYDVNQAIVALQGTPIANAKSVAALRKYKLGAQIGTTSYDYIVKNIKPSTKPGVYDTNNDAITALKNKQIDGIVVDLPTAFYVTAAQIENSKIVGQFPSVGSQERFGLVFAKGNPLVACVDKAIVALKRNGTLGNLRQQWLAKAGGAPVLK